MHIEEPRSKTDWQKMGVERWMRGKGTRGDAVTQRASRASKRMDLVIVQRVVQREHVSPQYHQSIFISGSIFGLQSALRLSSFALHFLSVRPRNDSLADGYGLNDWA